MLDQDPAHRLRRRGVEMPPTLPLHILLADERREFALAIVDMEMPGMNGYETTKRLRAMGVKSPVIALTAFDKEEVKAEVFASGMNDIMIKPFEPNQLFEVIL